VADRRIQGRRPRPSREPQRSQLYTTLPQPRRSGREALQKVARADGEVAIYDQQPGSKMSSQGTTSFSLCAASRPMAYRRGLKWSTEATRAS
jgi:hypothetical protein